MMKAKLYLFAAAVMMVAVFSGCKEDPVAPTVVTKPASGISEGMATLNAEITNQGTDAVTKCGFYYNTSTDMSYPEVVEANAGSSNFSAVISNLEPGKTYYYMAYAKSNAGLAEGEVLQFVTQAVKPTVETRPVSEVTTSGATLNAAIPSNGGSEITACGFYYSTSENMSNKATADFTGTPDSLFSVAISGLQSFTTYYYKAYATNALGSVEGEVMQFTTVIPPSVTTNAATDIYSSSATLNGNVTNHGGTTSTIRGFVYGTSADNLADSVTSGTGSGAYSKSIAGLAPSTTYYFKAFASNSAGTVYGELKQFTTLSHPQGAIDGVFSISVSTQVYFSQGNLQYRASTGTWQFAANQYDCIGSANSNISSSYSGWIDLFGWGTGSNPTNSTTSSYSTFTDWGNNAISNGGNQSGLWRTLTKDEWGYLLISRTNATSLVGKATVNGVAGLIILPDNWTLPPLCSFTSGTGSAFTTNTYTTSQWALMEAAGAVFLPAAGVRYGTSVSGVGSSGSCWSSTAYDSGNALNLNFSGSNAGVDYGLRGFGRSVRLVRVVQN